jgi:hypothetical protein
MAANTNNSLNNAIINAATIVFDALGAIEINSSGGAISIGNDAVNQAINVGTSGVRTETIGSTTGASVLALKYGTGDFTLASATGTIISALDTGEIRRAYQPAFSALLSVTKADVTGNGTNYVPIFDTEVFDQNADYNNGTGIFTAPVTGRYLLRSNILWIGGTANSTSLYLLMISSNRSYLYQIGYTNNVETFDANKYFSSWNSALADMDAADTVYMQATAFNGLKKAGLAGGLAAEGTIFCGFLVC